MKPEFNKDTGKWEFTMFGKIQSFDDESTDNEYWMLFQDWIFSDPVEGE